MMTTLVTIEQDDPVRERLADLPGYAKNAGCAYDRIGAALRWFGWDFAGCIDPSVLAADSGSVELELSTMFGDCVDCMLYLQWNGNARRAGEISYSVFIN